MKFATDSQEDGFERRPRPSLTAMTSLSNFFVKIQKFKNSKIEKDVASLETNAKRPLVRSKKK